MRFVSRVKEFIMNVLKTYAKKEFNVNLVSSAMMETAQSIWQQIIAGHPYWISGDKDIRTINFAKFLCQYTAKKTCLDLKVTVSGSERAKYIDKCISRMILKSIRDKVEDACGLGGIILKPSGTYNPSGAIDYVMPGNFVVTEKDNNGVILGAIFIDRIICGSDYYTRLEYHHFVQMNTAVENTEELKRVYVIENRAYKSSHKDSLGRMISLTDVSEWAAIQPQLIISNVEKVLFAYFKMPYNNTIDYESPEGVAMFSNCIEELRDLDIAWSMKGNEVEDSKHMTFIDERRILKADVKNMGIRTKIKLPRFVQGIRQGIEESNAIQEHVATLLTGDRITDINSILSMISTKAGFSQGQFVLDRKTGMVTATQIESDDNETVETIMDVRSALQSSIRDLIYALDKYCDIFFDMPSGYVNALDDEVPNEDIFYFKDLMSTFEQDRMRALKLITQGVYSKKKYLIEYEGFDEKEAEIMLAEAAAENNAGKKDGLFDEE